MSATKIERGDIFYVHKTPLTYGSEQEAGRPGIVVSNPKNNEYSGAVEVVFTTTREKKPLPTHVTIRSTPLVSTALCEQITTVTVERLGDYIGRVSDIEMANLETAMLVSLDICLDSVREKTTEAPIETENQAVVEVKAPVVELVGEITNVARTMAERDTYKLMYEHLLDLLIKAS